METRIAEFMANLLNVGLKQEQVAERGYEYAIASQMEHRPKDSTYVSAAMMEQAARWVNAALPVAYRIYESYHQTR